MNPDHAGVPADLRALALRGARGDLTALNQFIATTSATVWRVCAALVDSGAADDLTQETYLRALRSLPSYQGRSGPVPWLITIARRVCAEEISARQRSRELLGRLATQQAPRSVEPTPVTDLADLVGRLPTARREAFVLTAVAGLSYADAAVVCGCPIGTVRSRVARARAELVKALAAAQGPAWEATDGAAG